MPAQRGVYVCGGQPYAGRGSREGEPANGSHNKLNLLSVASRAVGGLNANIKVTLIRRDAVWTDGVAGYEETGLDVFAQVQPVKAEVAAKDTYLQGVDARNFWITGKKADVANFFESATKTNTLVLYRGKIWTVYHMDDWNGNGWIKITGVLSDSEPQQPEEA